ncbi:CBS domain-containing protein [Candidatus Bathyarchaeota archaeon]|nr:MAG: CBS domain-containing protein [Candidatus Bathyarchaeota archaeon]
MSCAIELISRPSTRISSFLAASIIACLSSFSLRVFSSRYFVGSLVARARVVREGDIVKGLITASDIYYAMKSYVLGKNMMESFPMEIRDIKISELMKAPMAIEFMEACGLTGTNMCIVLGEDDTVANAIRVMAIGGVDHILIIGDDGISGTLSDNDLLEAFL